MEIRPLTVNVIGPHETSFNKKLCFLYHSCRGRVSSHLQNGQSPGCDTRDQCSSRPAIPPLPTKRRDFLMQRDGVAMVHRALSKPMGSDTVTFATKTSSCFLRAARSRTASIGSAMSTTSRQEHPLYLSMKRAA